MLGYRVAGRGKTVMLKNGLYKTRVSGIWAETQQPTGQSLTWFSCREKGGEGGQRSPNTEQRPGRRARILPKELRADINRGVQKSPT